MKIPFDNESRKKFYSLLDKIFESSHWSEGQMLRTFEDKFSESVGLHTAGVHSGGAALSALYDYVGVKGYDVIIPTNTFWATAQSAKKAGANIIYADCKRDDLCLGLDEIKKKITPKTKAVVVVHIGGHIAFEIEEISSFCKSRNIALIEDCAHAHGASFNGKMAGSWGIGGAYSFYATKTMPMGDGGVVVSKNSDLIEWVKKYRNYGKEIVNGQVTYPLKDGFNFRLSEFLSALGIVQLENLPKILDWKSTLAQKYDQVFQSDVRVNLPVGMKSGFYKYIVFNQKLKEQTGKVFAPTDFCHFVDGVNVDLPVSSWVGQNHSCAPIWYGWPHADKSVEELKAYLLGD